MRLGISTASFFGRLATEQALEQIGGWKAPVAEVFMDTFSEYKADFVRPLRRQADRMGVEVRSVHALCTQFEPQLFSRSDRQREDAERILEDVLCAGEILGAKYYVFHGVPRRKTMDPTLPLDRGFVQRLNGIAERAGRHGLKLALENVCWCTYAFVGVGAQLEQMGASDNIVYTLDIKQAVLSGYPVQDYIEDMGARLAHVHLCDYRPRGNGQYAPCLPGEGELDIPRLLETLRERGYAGDVILEVYENNYKQLEQLHACYQSLQSLVQAGD